MKSLKPYELHLGHGSVISMEDLYFYKSLHDEWQQKDDHSSEYKDSIFYSHNADYVLTLIDKGYAELVERKSFDFEVQYFIRMRRNY